MNIKGLISTSAFLLLSHSATAAFVFNDQNAISPLPGNNNFRAQLAAEDLDAMVIGQQLSVDQDGTITFRFIGSESGYTNSFNYQSNTLFTEQQSNYSFNFDGYDTGSGIAISFDVKAGDVLDLGFSSNNSGALSPVENLSAVNLEGLGIIFDQSISDSLYSQLVLAYDDQLMPTDDDNHDDMLIRAEFTPVPLPASLILFASGALGLLSIRKKNA